jgi:selenide, water dikinase
VVASDTRDDAAVYRLPDGTGLVQTLDFFTPIVDDPFDWGRIAAANALSDVYAMGGTPRLALNIVAWPIEELSTDLLAQVLRGGAKVASEAGVAVVGGHSIHDPEPKYGMAVTGFVDLEQLVLNSTAPLGAELYLTKPLGIGIITTAIKRGKATIEQIEQAVETMTALNAAPAQAMVEVGVEAATDVTGYGLLGHLHEMLSASGVAADIDAASVPFLNGTLELAESGVVPSGTRSNLAFVGPHVEWGELSEPEQLALADAQTSGGLLIAVSPERAERLTSELAARGVPSAKIGETVDGPPGRITVRGRIART